MDHISSGFDICLRHTADEGRKEPFKMREFFCIGKFCIIDRSLFKGIEICLIRGKALEKCTDNEAVDPACYEGPGMAMGKRRGSVDVI